MRKDDGVGAIFDEVTKFFKEAGWPYSQMGERTALNVTFQGKNGSWNCLAQVDEERYIFLFYSYCPVKAPEDKRPILADFLTRANYGLYVGNFEMDFNDGEVRYKTSVDVEGDWLSQPLIKQMVYTNFMIMDKYLPGIMSVIYGGASPTEAIAQVEGPSA
jgi:hypothetical protein